MCLVIDTCCLSKVFNPNNCLHSEFKPILKWITDSKQKGRVIYGGTTYEKELRKMLKYHRVLGEFEKKGRVKIRPRSEVDSIERKLKKMEPAPTFNDAHLVAIVISSRCKVICTDDGNASKYLKEARFYPRGISRPKIYSRKQHDGLATDPRNVVSICKE